MELVWTLALISYMSTLPNIQYVGRFPEEATCLKAAAVSLPLGSASIKAVCVQTYQQTAAPAAPTKK
jgi:hypothetical protein